MTDIVLDEDAVSRLAVSLGSRGVRFVSPGGRLLGMLVPPRAMNDPDPPPPPPDVPPDHPDADLLWADWEEDFDRFLSGPSRPGSEVLADLRRLGAILDVVEGRTDAGAGDDGDGGRA